MCTNDPKRTPSELANTSPAVYHPKYGIFFPFL